MITRSMSIVYSTLRGRFATREPLKTISSSWTLLWSLTRHPDVTTGVIAGCTLRSGWRHVFIERFRRCANETISIQQH